MSDTEGSVVRVANTLTTWDSRVKLTPASVQACHTASPTRISVQLDVAGVRIDAKEHLLCRF
jgi:hypothetical protein